jgi:hypothetical protein
MAMSDEKKPPTEGKGEGHPAGGAGGPLGADLSSIWQSALGQIDEIRDVIVRGSQAGKAKLDAQLLKRQRDKLLAQIGERAVEEHRRGAAPLPEGSEDLLRSLDEVEKQIAESESEAARAMRR